MLNHARTLLMNVSATTSGSVTIPGDELIDPAFRQVTLPAYLLTLRRILFGYSPDKYMLNYRCRQLLTVLHSTPLEGYAAMIDPRITYRLHDAELVGPELFRTTVTQLTGTASDRLTIIGTPKAPDDIGRMSHRFHLDALTTTTVRVTKQSPPISKAILEFNTTTLLPLAEAGYVARLATTNTGQSWLIDLVNRPQLSLSDILTKLENSSEPVLDQLFGITPVEPYATLRQLWRTKKELPLKLSAMLLAIVFRTEEKRVTGGR